MVPKQTNEAEEGDPGDQGAERARKASTGAKSRSRGRCRVAIGPGSLE